MLEKLMLRLGYVKLPKVKDGQYLRHPVACKNPVRKPKCEVTTDVPENDYVPF
jgi:hypothetical protein